MSEAGYVELPIIQWLSGEGSVAPNDTGAGWTYRDEEAMAAFDRPLEDPIVEKLLIEAVKRINDQVKTDEQARMAVAILRNVMSHPDKLTANRETLDRLRERVPVNLVPGQSAQLVRFIEFDPARQHLNNVHRSDQYRMQVPNQCRQ